METDPVFTLTVFGTIFLVAWVILTALRQPVSGLSDFGQGLLGIASLFALLTAGWLYYLEGRAKARHEVSAVGTIAPMMPEGGKGRVLVQLVGSLENRGAFPEEYDCVGVDVRGFEVGRLAADPRYGYDVLTVPLRPASPSPQWNHCMEIEEARWAKRARRNLRRLNVKGGPRSFRRPDSGFRFSPFTLQAGESRTLDYEIVVPCVYPAIRLHFMVPTPGGDSAPEAKAVLSLLDACRTSEQAGKAGGRAPPPSPTRVEFGATG